MIGYPPIRRQDATPMIRIFIKDGEWGNAYHLAILLNKPLAYGIDRRDGDVVVFIKVKPIVIDADIDMFVGFDVVQERWGVTELTTARALEAAVHRSQKAATASVLRRVADLTPTKLARVVASAPKITQAELETRFLTTYEVLTT